MSIKIVYIDDEPGMCQMFEDNFSSKDILVYTFFDLTNLPEKVLEIEPDLIFLDFRMPNTSGDQVASTLDPKVPKVLISGDLFIESSHKYLRIFEKPFNFDEMSKFINDFLIEKKSHAL
jgi:DNA-binding NtrC family response regulator